MVRHLKLGNSRILKSIRKKNSNSHDYQEEAKLLINLRHPGIPQLYDFGEDDEYICLIEELVSGMSLRDFLLRHDIGLNEIIHILDKVSDILIYLHTRKPPILYQDLKPEHIIMNGDDIRLIDYGIARTIENSHNVSMNFGTPRFASPEAKNGLSVDERTDIYSLGVLLAECLKHTNEKIPYSLESLVKKATEEEKENRLSSVDDFKEMLKKSSHSSNEANSKKRFIIKNRKVGCLHKKIALIGSEHGIGTTHIALALTCYLNSTGRDAIYENRSGTDVTTHLLENEGHFKMRENVIYHGSFKGLREYGKSVSTKIRDYEMKVIDCGTDFSKTDDIDLLIYVFSSCPWKSLTIDKNAEISEHSIILVNPELRPLGIKLSRFFKRQVFGFPKADDAFVITKRKKEIFERILKGM